MAPLVFKTSLGTVMVLGGFDSLPSPPLRICDSALATARCLFRDNIVAIVAFDDRAVASTESLEKYPAADFSQRQFPSISRA